jgi:hypothetical protein
MGSAVLVDASAGTFYTFQGRMIIGGAYRNLLARTIQDVTRGLIASPAVQAEPARSRSSERGRR